MKLFDVDTVAQAKKKLVDFIGTDFLKTEIIPVDSALGMVCAEEIRSRIDVPGFLRSTVDGYAVIAKDTQGAGEGIPAFLKVAGEVFMGQQADRPISSGECIYVPTGGMLPPGADAMVMVEYCEPFGAGDVAVYNAVSAGRNTIEQGEDTGRGAVIIEKGTVIKAQHIGAMASCGVNEVCVFKPLRVTVISTGDEILSPREDIQPGKIYDINTYSIAAMAETYGHKVIEKAVVPDQEDFLFQTFQKAMAESDLVCISGGSSQGKKDMTGRLIDQLASPGVFTHGLALKPGKPTILGYDESSSTLLCGLPGHPAAAVMVFELIVMDALAQLQGRREPIYVYADMEMNLGCDAGKTNCIMVKLLPEKGGYTARPILGKSGLISVLTEADGYIVTEHNLEGIKAGETVKVRLFR